MSYKESLIVAGAKVLEFQHFGDYQGSWFALVDYQDERGWVEGSFGSCSMCDAFQNEFGSEFESVDYDKRLISFGESYLGGLQSSLTISNRFADDQEWDGSAGEVFKWITSMARKYRVK